MVIEITNSIEITDKNAEYIIPIEIHYTISEDYKKNKVMYYAYEVLDTYKNKDLTNKNK